MIGDENKTIKCDGEQIVAVTNERHFQNGETP